MRANGYISTHTVDVLCEILDCPVENILKYKKNSDE